jgi:hypothetical protein
MGFDHLVPDSWEVLSKVREHAVDLRAEVLGHLRVRDDEQILVVVLIGGACLVEAAADGDRVVQD